MIGYDPFLRCDNKRCIQITSPQDRAQKMDVLRRWLEEDEVRISVTENRRKEREQERQKKV